MNWYSRKLASVFVLCGSSLGAQNASADTTLLALPAPAELRCTPGQTTWPDRPGVVSFTFEVGSELDARTRSMIAKYDSLGNPLSFQEIGSRRGWTRDSVLTSTTEMVLVVFRGGHPATGFTSVSTLVASADLEAAPPQDPAKAMRDLTNTDRRSAAELMRWLWRHRCSR